MRYNIQYRVYKIYLMRLDGKPHFRHTFHKVLEAPDLEKLFEVADRHIRCAHENVPYVIRAVWNNTTGHRVYRLKLTDEEEQDCVKRIFI